MLSVAKKTIIAIPSTENFGHDRKRSNCLPAPWSSSTINILNIPNNPPRWPEVIGVLKTIIETYEKDARAPERVGEWIERIGWEKFFERTGLPFIGQCIDDFGAGARVNLRASTQFKW